MREHCHVRCPSEILFEKIAIAFDMFSHTSTEIAAYRLGHAIQFKDSQLKSPYKDFVTVTFWILSFDKPW